jgi:hypothetical protein
MCKGARKLSSWYLERWVCITCVVTEENHRNSEGSGRGSNLVPLGCKWSAKRCDSGTWRQLVAERSGRRHHKTRIIDLSVRNKTQLPRRMYWQDSSAWLCRLSPIETCGSVDWTVARSQLNYCHLTFLLNHLYQSVPLNSGQAKPSQATVCEFCLSQPTHIDQTTASSLHTGRLGCPINFDFATFLCA